MSRKKVKLAYIINDSARKATCRNRKKSLMKKVGELSTLCGIDACAIMCSPYESQPEVMFEDNREKEMVHVMFQNIVEKGGVHGLNMTESDDLVLLMEQYRKVIQKRIEVLTSSSSNAFFQRE